jgi:hypothetical protein
MFIESSPGGVGEISPQQDLRRTASEGNTGPGTTSAGASDGVPSDTTEDDWSRGSGEDPDLEIDQDLGQGDHTEISELDRRVSLQRPEYSSCKIAVTGNPHVMLLSAMLFHLNT